MLNTLAYSEKTQNEIHKINKQNLLRVLVILFSIDVLVFEFQKSYKIF